MIGETFPLLTVGFETIKENSPVVVTRTKKWRYISPVQVTQSNIRLPVLFFNIKGNNGSNPLWI
jgi:hypothetical protein